MERRPSAIARIIASLALVAAVVAVIVVLSGSFDEPASTGSGQGKQTKSQTTNQRQQQQQQQPKAKRYVVKSGDTLSAIAEKTGVSVEELRTLNPRVDPLTLVEGETLKLR